MNLSAVPTTSGIYQFLNKDGEILYIGKAINLKNRIKNYFQKNILSPRTRQMVSQINSIKTIKTESEFDALLLEAKLIREIMPKYNVIWRDDKHPLYIKITKEPFPKIRTVRREDDKKSTYYGPFPSSGTVYQTLRFIREIFPYCQDNRVGKRACFYSHIGLCSPCPNNISKLEGSPYKSESKRYNDNIRMIIKLFNGKAKAVIYKLEQEMKQYAKKEQFEKAAIISQKLNKLFYLRQKRTPVKEYMKNPNLYDDIRQQELVELAKRIGLSAINRIEGYDISNTQGTNATGSMVTFVDGEPDKSYYRKFKIRLKNSPDDTFMMHEILTRRLKHDDWPYPDLVMVDGGKGQIQSALTAMDKINKHFPLIGLAKRLEEIIIVQENGTYKTIRLSKDSQALHLIQRIRDEAHRFANTYHKKLRLKTMV